VATEAVSLEDLTTMVETGAAASLVVEVITILTQAHQEVAAELLATAVHLPAEAEHLAVAQEILVALAAVHQEVLVVPVDAGINFAVPFSFQFVKHEETIHNGLCYAYASAINCPKRFRCITLFVPHSHRLRP
jgi:hypothetical protein